MNEQTGYNGWTDRATWATALHWDNDQGSYSERCAMVENACDDATGRAHAIDILADNLEARTDEVVGEALAEMPNEWARVYIMDMMEDGVNWAEIAGNWIDEEERTYGQAGAADPLDLAGLLGD